MKLSIKQQVAGYKSELRIKSKDGNTVKHFNSTSGVDFAQADQNCYKRAEYWLNRAILFLKKEKHYLGEYEQRIIKESKITLKEAQELQNKLSEMIIRPNIKELDI